MSIFANEFGLIRGEWSDDHSSVILYGDKEEKRVENTFDDPLIELSEYDYLFSCSKGRNVEFGRWEDYCNEKGRLGFYQVIIPLRDRDGISYTEPTFIIVLKDCKEAIIFVLPTTDLNRKELSSRVNWAMKTNVYGHYGRRNILHGMQAEYRLAIINECSASKVRMSKLLDELRLKILLDEDDVEIIKPDKTFDHKVGYSDGKWFEIEDFGSMQYYKIIKEIYIPTREVKKANNTKASTKHTIFNKDGSMTVVTLYEDGDLSAHTFQPSDLMKLDDCEYSPVLKDTK